MPDFDWQTINSFAPWLSGIGTLAAASVALHLARREHKIDLRLSAGLRSVIPLDGPNESFPEVLRISVVNAGRRPATITHVGWRWGFPGRKRRAVHVTEVTQGVFALGLSNSSLPIELRDGAEACWHDRLDNDRMRFRRYAWFCAGRFPALRARFIEVAVSTSTGEEFRARIESELRNKLAASARKGQVLSPHD